MFMEFVKIQRKINQSINQSTNQSIIFPDTNQTNSYKLIYFEFVSYTKHYGEKVAIRRKLINPGNSKNIYRNTYLQREQLSRGADLTRK